MLQHLYFDIVPKERDTLDCFELLNLTRELSYTVKLIFTFPVVCNPS